MWFSISVYCPAVGHFVAVFDVITARKEAEQNVRRLNAELEQRVHDRTAQLEAANRELEAFSYSVSHDLRAPLRAIDGFAGILMEDHGSRLDSEGRRVVDVIRGEAARMAQLIDDLLTFSRASRGQMRSAAIDMTTLARAVFDECAAQAPGRKLRLQLGTLLPAVGDPSLMRQVLANLLSNAIKYTRPRAEAEVELGSRVEGNRNVYWVKDNGVGFNPKYVDKLFGIFQRLHTYEEFEGTGVGLALVARIVRRHGGQVWAESEVNRGAVFYFALPNGQERA
jgi:signal transduction histidine kinase